MDNFTITEGMVKDTLVQPYSGDPGEAHYVVVFRRSSDDEAVDDNGGLPTPHAGITQLCAELQHAYDETGIAGTFHIVARHAEGRWVTLREAFPDMDGPVSIFVAADDGTDLTHTLAHAEHIDGNLRAGTDAPLGSRGAVGRLSNLSEDVALACLCQIIDTGREWGPTDEMAELLYKQAELLVRGKGGLMVLPDGWLVKVHVKVPVAT